MQNGIDRNRQHAQFIEFPGPWATISLVRFEESLFINCGTRNIFSKDCQKQKGFNQKPKSKVNNGDKTASDVATSAMNIEENQTIF